ncbi:hypothetical protein GSH19_03590 [Lactobacillus sp. S2-2]|uniref:hypothetical protein n=1 Tax=Lactobacillus sp. S2-2 TaxID=2692917 RepID=UPI001F3F8612|nr:hypothetical protein [Lactobacillus sp. S2-2]MCF6515235.1 hypothetical protein [Lactobacillus sp. S2-2]
MTLLNIMIILSAVFSSLFALLAFVEIIYSFYTKLFPKSNWNSNYDIKIGKQKYSIRMIVWMILGYIIIYSMVFVIPIYIFIRSK